MNKKAVEKIVKDIVNQSTLLKNKYLENDKSPIDWVCIFSQSELENKEFNKTVKSFGKVIQETETGPIYKLDQSIKTNAGRLLVLKIRKPDKKRPQRGDGDYRVGDFKSLKRKYLSKRQFSLIKIMWTKLPPKIRSNGIV